MIRDIWCLITSFFLLFYKLIDCLHVTSLNEMPVYEIMPFCSHSHSISFILMHSILFSFVCVIFYRHLIVYTHALRHLEVVCIHRSPLITCYTNCSVYWRKGVNAWYKHFTLAFQCFLFELFFSISFARCVFAFQLICWHLFQFDKLLTISNHRNVNHSQ